MRMIVVETGNTTITPDDGAAAALRQFLSAETQEEVAAAATVQVIANLLIPVKQEPAAPYRTVASLAIGGDSDEPLMVAMRGWFNAGADGVEAAGATLRELAAEDPQQAFSLHMLLGTLLLPEVGS